MRLVADYKINLRGVDYDSPEYQKLKSEVRNVRYCIYFNVHEIFFSGTASSSLINIQVLICLLLYNNRLFLTLNLNKQNIEFII